MTTLSTFILLAGVLVSSSCILAQGYVSVVEENTRGTCNTSKVFWDMLASVFYYGPPTLALLWFNQLSIPSQVVCISALVSTPVSLMNAWFDVPCVSVAQVVSTISFFGVSLVFVFNVLPKLI